MFLGTAGFDDPDPHTILKLSLCHADGALSVAGEPTKTEGQNPGWVCVPPGMGMAYVGMEDEAGAVQPYKIDPCAPRPCPRATLTTAPAHPHPLAC